LTGLVLSDLAQLHRKLAVCSWPEPNWDYEAELQDSAQLTLDTFDRILLAGASENMRDARRWLRRIVLDLPRIRQSLLDNQDFPRTTLHGDVHSGNVVLRSARGTPSTVLLDWGRARCGSPFEDVSSWLQSLSHWEPEARRRHDTLVRYYLRARGGSDVLHRSVRDLYWLAAACNVLAGALRYHLVVAGSNDQPARVRVGAHGAVRHQLRVIRRAHAVWCD
jgi:Ser/Thr protein kinase RdoA (MazF antagonist)